MRFDAAVRQFATHALAGNPERTVAIGPLVWELPPAHDTRAWYFVVASGDAKGTCRLDQVKVPKGHGPKGAMELAAEARVALLAEIGRRKPPAVIHDFDDELLLAQFCEAAWPSPLTSRLRERIEKERNS